MSSSSAVVCLALLAFTAATDVTRCPDVKNANFKVELKPCKKLPCRLVRKTNTYIEATFTPDKDIKDIQNKVTAEVLTVVLPFVGVDGISICDKLFTESGEKASCPVKAGTTYTYKDSFYVHPFYPTISTTVHWELLDKDDLNEKLVCFNVGAKIV